MITGNNALLSIQDMCVTKVYEICDTTSEEAYYPLGIFLSIDEVNRQFKKFDDSKEKVTEYGDDTEEISVFEREIGWSEHGKLVMIIEREEYYDEDADEYFWRRIGTQDFR